MSNAWYIQTKWSLFRSFPVLTAASLMFTTIRYESWGVQSDDLEGCIFISNFGKGRRGEGREMEEGNHQDWKTLIYLLMMAQKKNVKL